MKKAILSGNEAIARGFIEAGGKLAAAYPGTPSTEVLETLSHADGIHAEWSVNEKVALEVAIGGALSGVRSLACMKHVGVNVAADPLMTVAYTGINAGLVLMAADDPGMFSSQNEQDTRHYARHGQDPLHRAVRFCGGDAVRQGGLRTFRVLRHAGHSAHHDADLALQERCGDRRRPSRLQAAAWPGISPST